MHATLIFLSSIHIFLRILYCDRIPVKLSLPIDNISSIPECASSNLVRWVSAPSIAIVVSVELCMHERRNGYPEAIWVCGGGGKLYRLEEEEYKWQGLYVT